MLKHLMTDHGMTPTDYRAKWNLPSDYPMVAPDYAEARRGFAVKIGLGRKRKAGAKTEAKPATAAAAPKARRERPPKSA